MSARFLDDEAEAAFLRAIAAIEATSAVEVVVSVRRRSASYLHANLIVGVVVAFVGLAAMMFADTPFSHSAILLDPFVVGALAGAAVQLTPGIKRLLTPAAARRAYVERAARATFVERGVHTTRDRSGLLVYISWLEHDIAVVADTGLAAHASSLATAEAHLVAAIPRGGVAVAGVLEALAPAMAAAMVRRPDDINELPDAIDTDLGRRGPRAHRHGWRRR